MAKVAVFIDHDITVRHFLLSGVVPSLEDDHDVVYVFPRNHRRVSIEAATLPIGRVRTMPVAERRLHRYRRLYHAAVLMRTRHSSDKAPVFQFWREVLGRRAFATSWLFSWPVMHTWYRRRILRDIGDNEELDQLLVEEKPDAIVHPTVLEGLFVADLIRSGERQHIPTVYLMNSWDNPAVKAVTVGSPTKLVVWGDHSKQLAHERLGIPLDRLVSFGAAQFDVYRRPPRETPRAYRERLGIRPDTKLLLYAGSSKGLNETLHLLRLEQAISRGELANCVVLYRPHPWRGEADGERSFFSLPWQHVRMAPDMVNYYRERMAGRNFIYMADYGDTHVTLSAVDAVISPLSTILLEAALHGKAIAAYLPDEDMRTNVALSIMAKTVHFREFFNRVECVMCRRPEDLVRDCRVLLERASEPAIAQQLMKQCEFFVEPQAASYAQQLRTLVNDLISLRSA